MYKCAVVHPVAISQCDEPLLFLYAEKNAKVLAPVCCFIRPLVNSHTLPVNDNKCTSSYEFLMLPYMQINLRRYIVIVLSLEIITFV